MLLMTLLIGACAATSSPSASPSALPPPTATPTAVPSISHEPASGAIDLTARSGTLPPGTYTRTGFKPPITLTLGEGWFAGTLNDGFFDVQQDQGTPDVIAVQFARVDALVDATGATIPATSAEEAARTIEANPGLVVSAHDESRLGGLTGFNLVVENTSGSHTSILDVAVGRLGIDSGRRLWISLFDTVDGLLAVMVGGSIARWDHALAVAEPVLESVVIDGSR